MKGRYHPSRIWNAIKASWQVDVCRLLPLGLFNWCYLCGSNCLIDRPCTASFGGGPAINCRFCFGFLWNYVVVFIGKWSAAPRQIQSAVLSFGPEIEARHGIALAEQRRNIHFLAKSWSISPAYAYTLGLYKPHADALHYILSGEVQPFHRLMNEARRASHVITDCCSIKAC